MNNQALAFWIAAFGTANLGVTHHYHGNDWAAVAGGVLMVVFIYLALREERRCHD